MQDVEVPTIRKVSARLISFLIVCYFIAYLDRVNVGFAAITMNKALGLTATMFGFGSGIFFLAYFLFEVPSNCSSTGSGPASGSRASWSAGASSRP